MNWYTDMRGKVTEQNALDLTIGKFEKVLSGEIKLKFGAENCPLCLVYLWEYRGGGCYNCPVSKAGQECETVKQSLYQELMFWDRLGKEMGLIEQQILPFLRKLKEEQVESNK